jgi:hypothetical protein
MYVPYVSFTSTLHYGYVTLHYSTLHYVSYLSSEDAHLSLVYGLQVRA